MMFKGGASANLKRGPAIIRRNAHLGAALRLAPYAAFAGLVFLTFPVTPDDAFITLRYAAHILAGHGPVFNVGDRTEGFSSPLHLLLSVVLLSVFGSSGVIAASKFCGIALGAWTLREMGLVASRLGLTASETTVAQLLVALNINFAISAVNGLETMLYAALLTALVERSLREYAQTRGYGSSLLVLACVLVRPDAVLLLPLLLLIRMYLMRRGRFDPKNVVLWTACAAIPFAALLAARFAYYGDLLPNTYYAKVGNPWHSILDGARYLLRPLSPKERDLLSGAGPLSRVVLLTAPIAFWALAGLGLWRRRHANASLFVAAVPVVSVIFVLRSGGDWMAGWRFSIVAAPALAIFQCVGLRVLAHGAQGAIAVWKKLSSRSVLRHVHAIALAFWVPSLLVAPKANWMALGLSTDGATLLHATGAMGNRVGAQQVDAARLVSSVLPVGARVATTEIGFMGFSNM
ncbi:MAG TPA: hypothetical protein VKU41_00040, partial [Polyangiaceae bacterium]|nr:hypothetical protein [Polyangiaceae bacterium]